MAPPRLIVSSPPSGPLRIDRTDLVGIVGENGGGKSTFAKKVVGIVGGADVQLVGERPASLTNLSPAERAALGVVYMPSDEGIFRRLSVAENLEIARVPSRASRAAFLDGVANIRRLIGPLLAPDGQDAGTLSGGEARFLALARAWLTMSLLRNAPFPLLIADEPTSGIHVDAVPIVARIFASLRENAVALLVLEQSGTTLMFERVYSMENGVLGAAC
jgi:ABC-type branched-subunit amino acid transport system ATPase component